MNIDANVTGVVVTWNSKEIIKTALDSIRNFHPTMKIVIVDGSDKDDECYSYLDSTNSQLNYVHHTNYNIGHGRGLRKGLEFVHTPFALIFDSDIEMIKSPLRRMLNKITEDTFGVGYITKTDINGFPIEEQYQNIDQPTLDYMQPFFQLIQLKEYYKYSPYIHHGSPAINIMRDIHKKGLSNTVLKNFKEIPHSALLGAQKYIVHTANHGIGGVTGSMRVKAGLPHIEGAWEQLN